jgi:hypothetical protein
MAGALALVLHVPAIAAVKGPTDTNGNYCTARVIPYKWENGRMVLNYHGRDALKGTLFSDQSGKEFWQPSPQDRVLPRDPWQTKIYMPAACAPRVLGYSWSDVLKNAVKGTIQGAGRLSGH